MLLLQLYWYCSQDQSLCVLGKFFVGILVLFKLYFSTVIQSVFLNCIFLLYFSTVFFSCISQLYFSTVFHKCISRLYLPKRAHLLRVVLREWRSSRSSRQSTGDSSGRENCQCLKTGKRKTSRTKKHKTNKKIMQIIDYTETRKERK